MVATGTRAVSTRPLRVVGAPTNLGLAPYPTGSPRKVDEAPARLRATGLVARLGASDRGDVRAPAYRDLQRGELAIRNAEPIADHARALALALQSARADDAQTIVLGGDCSVLLGILLGLGGGGRHGLVFIDGHCDFARPELSWSGGAAGMDLALAVGRVDHPLARLAGDRPLVREEDVVVIARKDLADEPHYGLASVRHTAIDDVPLDVARTMGMSVAAARALGRVGRAGLDGFWVHVDVDVLKPELMPAVDSPEPGGLDLGELAGLIRPLLAHPRSAGMDVTIYDPGLDPTSACAERLADLLVDALAREPVRTRDA